MNRKIKYSFYDFTKLIEKNPCISYALCGRVNKGTLNINFAFKRMIPFFSPNSLALCNFDNACPGITIERIKYTYVEKTESGMVIDVICGNLQNDIDNQDYKIFAII